MPNLQQVLVIGRPGDGLPELLVRDQELVAIMVTSVAWFFSFARGGVRPLRNSEGRARVSAPRISLTICRIAGLC